MASGRFEDAFSKWFYDKAGPLGKPLPASDSDKPYGKPNSGENSPTRCTVRLCRECGSAFDVRIQASNCPHDGLTEDGGVTFTFPCVICNSTRFELPLFPMRKPPNPRVHKDDFSKLIDTVAKNYLEKIGWVKINSDVVSGWMCPICAGVLRVKSDIESTN